MKPVHSTHDGSMQAMLGAVFSHRSLVMQMIKRDVIGRYRGSWLGLAWSFVNPMIMLVIYTFFFSVIFKARWGGGGESKGSFAIFLFVGLILHMVLAECITKAPALVTSNVNYVKRVVFPLEILPVISLGSALFHAAISFVVLFAAQVLLGYGLPWTAVFLPLTLIPLSLIVLGASWWLASLGVFVRDMAQVAIFFTTVMLFLSPVFFPASAMPEQFRSLLLVNPMTFIIEQSRAVLIEGRMPDFFGLIVMTWCGLVVAWLGFWWFQKTRKGFADVL